MRPVPSILTAGAAIAFGLACNRGPSENQTAEGSATDESESGSTPVCGGAPVVLATDPDHCGECDRSCRGGYFEDSSTYSPCVDGECQPHWDGCAPLRASEESNLSCQEFCQATLPGMNCVQDGCGGATLLIQTASVWNDFFTCSLAPEFETLPDYQCDDRLPLQIMPGGTPDNPTVDYFLCCCSDPS